jgi:hypothetical protein
MCEESLGGIDEGQAGVTGQSDVMKSTLCRVGGRERSRLLRHGPVT